MKVVRRKVSIDPIGLHRRLAFLLRIGQRSHQIDALPGAFQDVLPIREAPIHYHLLRRLRQILRHFLQRRQQAVGVTTALRGMSPHDDLVLALGGDLRVVAGCDGVVAVLHFARFRFRQADAHLVFFVLLFFLGLQHHHLFGGRLQAIHPFPCGPLLGCLLAALRRGFGLRISHLLYHFPRFCQPAHPELSQPQFLFDPCVGKLRHLAPPPVDRLTLLALHLLPKCRHVRVFFQPDRYRPSAFWFSRATLPLIAATQAIFPARPILLVQIAMFHTLA